MVPPPSWPGQVCIAAWGCSLNCSALQLCLGDATSTEQPGFPQSHPEVFPMAAQPLADIRHAKRDADAKSEKAVLLRTYLHITFEQNSVLGSSFDNNIHLETPEACLIHPTCQQFLRDNKGERGYNDSSVPLRVQSEKIASRASVQGNHKRRSNYSELAPHSHGIPDLWLKPHPQLPRALSSIACSWSDTQWSTESHLHQQQKPLWLLALGSQQVTEVQAQTTTSGTLQFPLRTTDVQIMHTPSFSNVKVAVPVSPCESHPNQYCGKKDWRLQSEAHSKMGICWSEHYESLGFGLVKMYDNYFSGFWGIRTDGYILHMVLATGFQRQDPNIGCHAPR
ncbi:hypothetical protein Anapl_00419 [Anas platyrhynchos]|uniref:Uncharacterized protein n=1 Tax=Anas platyrhynchos TaxID=8839 RepID=R0L624_ANAPL|nr:hypothetical protein Anapl_00419 [Anas platyrhynchos]